MEKKLRGIGIETCADLMSRRGDLCLLFSETSARWLIRVAIGIDSERKAEPRKSISKEHTFGCLDNKEDLKNVCKELCESLAQEMKKVGNHEKGHES